MKYLIPIFFTISFSAYSQPSHLMISQVYGGGGNSGATYSNDFIEIFNPGDQAMDLNGFSLQYSSASGTTWNSLIPLTGIIASKKYFLVQLAGGSNGVALPAPDLIATINLNATSGKIALVNSISSFSGTCPVSALIIDFLGYGNANCSEGLPAGQGSSVLSIIRKSAGCLDTENNSLDFISGAPSPRNSVTPMNDCSQMNSNLPVCFSNEKCVLQNGKFEISFTNESESEVDSYLIESSENGRDFSPVLKILPLKNDGSGTNYFAMIDYLPVINFLRVMGKELNGHSNYSKIIKTQRMQSWEKVRLFPNPVENKLTLELGGLENGNHSVWVHNYSGIIVKQVIIHSTGNNFIHLMVNNLPQGLYFVSVDGKIAGRFLK